MKILISTGGGNPANYVAAVTAAGGEPVAAYLPQPEEEYAGLVLTGGADMDPAFFGQENWASKGIDRDRDRAELALLDWFLGRGKPVLAICRGHQVANVWAGGDLLQDLGEGLVPFHQKEKGDCVHPVRAEEGSLLHRLYGPVFPTNSSHHQGVGRLGKGLKVTARSEGGVIEAMEHETLPLITTQFHPERMTGEHARPDTVDGGAIFEHFIQLCRAVEK